MNILILIRNYLLTCITELIINIALPGVYLLDRSEPSAKPDHFQSKNTSQFYCSMIVVLSMFGFSIFFITNPRTCPITTIILSIRFAGQLPGPRFSSPITHTLLRHSKYLNCPTGDHITTCVYPGYFVGLARNIKPTLNVHPLVFRLIVTKPSISKIVT